MIPEIPDNVEPVFRELGIGSFGNIEGVNDYARGKLNQIISSLNFNVDCDLDFESNKVIQLRDKLVSFLESLLERRYLFEQHTQLIDDEIKNVYEKLMLDYEKLSLYKAKLLTNIKEIIALRFPEAETVFPSSIACKTIIKVLGFSRQEILNGIPEKKFSGRVRLRRMGEVKKCLKESIGFFDYRRKEFDILIKEIENTEKEKEQITNSIKEFILKSGYKKLFEINGFQTINISRTLIEVGNITRFYAFNEDGSFSNKKSLMRFKAYAGLAVTTNQSGEKDINSGNKLYKSGNMGLRKVLYMASMSMLSLKKKYDKEVMEAVESIEQGEAVKLEPFSPVKYLAKFTLLQKDNPKTPPIVLMTKIMNKLCSDLFFLLKEINDNEAENSLVAQEKPLLVEFHS